MTTYALLAAAEDSSLHAREREWCTELAYEWRQLGAEGMVPPGADATPLDDVSLGELVTTIDVGRRDLEWDGGTIWVLADPALLREETGDLFRRSMKIVLDRLDCTLRYPYQHLDGNGQRAAWLTECLESEEIVSPRSFRASGVKGIGQGQMNLDSF
ncbi:hypothetical protein HTZ84_22425 [Haloterrigena sp. SYSU A558-1]|uniref:Uncharacterized protein n=1 Tax=Haloterrigena gelatinilytica TaxID=2741724 RepID=A0ABX2LFJ5_9EURY|nr:hypothetical protein [Haloterrigena gelatinilytica]NUC75024.1 hypothetical protein [Haloterrigena gelatinilytica]